MQHSSSLHNFMALVFWIGFGLVSAECFADSSKFVGEWAGEASKPIESGTQRLSERLTIEKGSDGQLIVIYNVSDATITNIATGTYFGDSSTGRYDLVTVTALTGRQLVLNGSCSMKGYKINSNGNVIRIDFSVDFGNGEEARPLYYYLDPNKKRLFAVTKAEANMAPNDMVNSINARLKTALVLKFEGDF